MKKLIAVFACLLLSAIGLFGQGPTGRTVTQITSTTTGVTINSSTGVITTFTETLAGAANLTFTVTNSAVEAGSAVVVNVQNYTGAYTTNGTPLVAVNNVAAGSFDIKVLNVHASNALAGVLQIAFHVR
jgi:hypothetical protein